MSKKEQSTYEVLATQAAGEKSLWKLQRTTFPDGTTALGLRRFILKADGTEQVTAMGFSLKEGGADFDAGVAAIITLLKRAQGGHTKAPSAADKQGSFVLCNRDGLRYGNIDWLGHSIKGRPMSFATADDAKDFRRTKCPVSYRADFRVKRES